MEHPPPNTSQQLVDNLTHVQQRVADAATRSGRHVDAIRVIAVTKYADEQSIRTLIDAGHKDFGENRAQQMADRAAELTPAAPTSPGRTPKKPVAALPEHNPVRWHMIGHLQRKKVKPVIKVARLIHSVDTLRLAEELHIQNGKLDRSSEILLQVNISGEESKYGVQPAIAPHLCEQIETMMHVRLRGIMTMAPYSDNPEDARPVFARCRELFEEIVASGAVSEHFNILSMGMTDDFEVAIEEGSNLVRVGRAIFGEPPDEA